MFCEDLSRRSRTAKQTHVTIAFPWPFGHVPDHGRASFGHQFVTRRRRRLWLRPQSHVVKPSPRDFRLIHIGSSRVSFSMLQQRHSNVNERE
jgi:hypothetical protein